MTNASTPPGVKFEFFPSTDVEGSIPRRFEAQVRRRPERLAVAAGARSLSYAALNSLANRIAWAILAASAQGEETVAVLLEKDARLIATLLAILKTGNIYVPLDPTYPPARNQAMLDDCGASLVVTEARHLPLALPLTSRGRRLLDLDTLDRALPTANPQIAVGPGSLASILYTSGSTGQPKGVLQNHRNTLHNVMNHTNSLRLTAEDRLSLVASSGVVGGVRDILASLLNGAAIFPFSLQTDSFAALAEWLNQERITYFNTVVTVFRHFVSTLADNQRFPTVRLLKCGSEALAASDLAAFRHHFLPTARIYSGFGTTETNNVTQILFDGDGELSDTHVPAGYPLPGMDLLVVDDSGAPVAPGAVGELLVKSRYLALGYWGRPDLTQAAFLPDPGGTEARLYRTGDLARLRPDGCLEHLGRRDAMVKVRGHRVELMEIELVLQSIAGVTQAAVVARERGSAENCVVAYVAPAFPAGPSTAQLRRTLQERVPSYMVPAAFMRLAALPSTSQGKVDRRALPEPDWERTRADALAVAPGTPLEAALAGLWASVLEVSDVKPQDDFLALGGDSLRAARLISSVKAVFGVDVPIELLFRDATTVAGMASTIEEIRARAPADKTARANSARG